MRAAGRMASRCRSTACTCLAVLPAARRCSMWAAACLAIGCRAALANRSFWGFGLNVGATITAAANVGSANSPEPEVQVVAQMQASGWFQSFTKSITLYANGATGFRVEV